MRIVFMGTPDFAVPSLRALIDNGYDVVGVFCQPDRPKGRGHKLAACPVKETAEAAGHSCLSAGTHQARGRRGSASQPCARPVRDGGVRPAAFSGNSGYSQTGNDQRSCVAAAAPSGSAPINWCVMMGETVTGITTMYTDIGMDTGDMLLKAETPIGETETAGELSDRLSELGAQLLVRTLRELEAAR